METTNKIPATEEHTAGNCRKSMEGFFNIVVSIRPSVRPSSRLKFERCGTDFHYVILGRYTKICLAT